jgi:hypothetical protein
MATRSAPDTDVHGGLGIHRFPNSTEIERPSIHTQARSKKFIDYMQDIGQGHDDRRIAVEDEPHAARWTRLEVAALEISERGVERSRSDERESGRLGDQGGERGGGNERVDVSASSMERAVEAVGERGGVGDRDEERALGPHHAGDFIEDVREPVHVLEGVVRDNRVEAGVGERHPRGIGLDASYPAVVQGHDTQVRIRFNREAAFIAAEVEHSRPRRQVAQDLVHYCLYRTVAGMFFAIVSRYGKSLSGPNNAKPTAQLPDRKGEG